MNLFERIYGQLYDFFGPQRWWPGESTEEIIIGAILTQNTNWSNVERAIHNLKRENALSLKKIFSLSPHSLSEMIRPSGYYNIKEKRLRAVADYFVRRCDSRFDMLNNIPLDALRSELLSVYGVGPETADSILLYALSRPVFVVDAYTRRIGVRHGLFPKNVTYEFIRNIFESSLEKKVPLFNEYHALIVRLGKDYCRSVRRCDSCPLNDKNFFCSFGTL
jgi:endonuclease-3 related protein